MSFKIIRNESVHIWLVKSKVNFNILKKFLLILISINLSLFYTNIYKFGIASILSFLTFIDNTLLKHQTYFVWWHLVLRGLMSYYHETHPEHAFSNCEHSKERSFLFVFFLVYFCNIRTLVRLSVELVYFGDYCLCFLWFFPLKTRYGRVCYPLILTTCIMYKEM